MTRTTESNTVFRVGIFLHIINVMNRLSALAADCAGVVIAFSNHALESIIERGRVWLERRTAIPKRMILALIVHAKAFMRTKGVIISLGTRKFSNILLAAIIANEFYSFHSGRIMAFLGTIFTALVACVNKKSFSTTRANLGFGSTSPPRRPVSFKFMRRMTGLGTIKSCLFENLVNKIGLTTIEAQSFNLSALPVGSFITNKMLRSPLTKTLTRTKSGRVFAERINLKALTTMLAYYLDLGFTIPVWHLVSKRSTPYAARAFAHMARA